MPVEHIPCGSFINESERRACEVLKSSLNGLPVEGLWLLLTNVLLSYSDHITSREVDLIVISPKGIRIVEIKHWDTEFINTQKHTVEAEAEKLNSKVKIIAGKLKGKCNAGFLRGQILLTKGNLKLCIPKNEGKNIRSVEFFGLKDWKKLLHIDEQQNIFDEASIRAIGKSLAPNIKISLDGKIRSFHHFTNLELHTPEHERFHRVYRGMHRSSRERVVVHLYDLSASDEINAEERAKREFDVLRRLQKSPHVANIYESFQYLPEYPGEFCFFAINDPLAPSLEKRRKDTKWPTQERIGMAALAAETLHTIHHPKEGPSFSLLLRNLTPESIRVKGNGEPLFTDFSLTKVPDASTVRKNDLSFDGKEPYTAPEVLSGGLGVADIRSDTYSLCASLACLFTGGSIEDDKALAIIRKGLAEAPGDRIPLDVLTKELRALGQETPENQGGPVGRISAVDYWDEGKFVEFKGSHYMILSRLGTGGLGITFKVVETDKVYEKEYGTYVAKVVFNEENGELVLKAYRKARACVHTHLSIIHEIAEKWEPNQFVTLMKWVEGRPLSDYTGVLPLYTTEDGDEESWIARVLRWLCDLLDALVALHTKGLVHGDVTPKNIIVHGEAVTLIDFDTCREKDTTTGVKTVAYCAPSVGDTGLISLCDDVFSLAASFFHVLFDREPFRLGGEFRKDKGFNWTEVQEDLKNTGDEKWDILVQFLNLAVHPDESRRFPSAMEAKKFLRNALFPEEKEEHPAKSEQEPQVLTPNKVPRLLDLLRSYPGSLKGNDETRGLDSAFAEETYVETLTDKTILDKILQGTVSLVILFGNAGDGKTAFLQHLAKKLLKNHEQKVYHSSKRLGKFQLQDGRTVHFNLDGSASYQGRSATELLDDFFSPFQDGNPPHGRIHLIAINSGPLQAWVGDYEQREGSTVLTEQLRASIEGDKEELDERFLLLDLNKRSLVGRVDKEKKRISTTIIDKLIDQLFFGQGEQGREENPWQPCTICSAGNHCTTRESIQAITHEQRGIRLRERLSEALQAVHQRGEIHITARELRASLCYIFFGTESCSDLHDNQSLGSDNFSHYYDRAFDSTSQHRQGELLKELALFDPALDAHPKIDRYLLSGNNDGPPRYPGLKLHSARRRAYFEWSDHEIAHITQDGSYFGLTGGNHLKCFRRVPFMTEKEKTDLCREVCNGIARLENLPFLAHDRDSQGVPLKIIPRTPTESILWVEKPFENFTLADNLLNDEKSTETLHTHLVLRYRYQNGNEEELFMSADLFHILMELKEGVQLSSVLTEDIFAHLSLFIQRLTQEDARTLYAWSPLEENAVFRVDARIAKDIQKICCTRIPGKEDR